MEFIEEQLRSLPHMSDRELVDSFHELRFAVGLLRQSESAENVEEMEEALEGFEQELKQRGLESAL